MGGFISFIIYFILFMMFITSVYTLKDGYSGGAAWTLSVSVLATGAMLYFNSDDDYY